MTIRELFDYVLMVKPHVFSDEVQLLWLNELEGRLQLDVFLLATEEVKSYSLPEDENTQLLVDLPHTGIYRYWMEAMVDLENGEYSKYQNDMEVFNNAWNEFACWFAETQGTEGDGVKYGFYLSAYGIAVKHGYIGSEEEWLLSLKGDPGKNFTYEDFTEEQLQALKDGVVQDALNEAESYANAANEAAQEAETQADAAKEAAQNAENKANSIAGMKAEAKTLAAGENATANAELKNGVYLLTLGIPAGKDGATGPAGADGYTPVKGIDYFDGQPGKDGADGTMSFEDLTDEQRESLRGPAGPEGPRGESGVYVGSGEMPENCNVQIDPNGTGETLEEMINAAVAEIKPGTGGASSWNELTDKPFDENNVIKREALPEGYPYKSGMTIEWDGNTEGRPNILGAFFHVSDVIISDDDLKNSTLVMSTGEATVVKDRWDYNVSHQIYILGGDFTFFSSGLIARKNNLEVNMYGTSFVVEKAGIYFAVPPEMSDYYLKSLSFGEVHTIAPEYLKLGRGLTVDENGAIALSLPSAEGGSF